MSIVLALGVAGLLSQSATTCEPPHHFSSKATSIQSGGETFYRLNSSQLRRVIVGHWVSDPKPRPGEPYRFVDVIRFDRGGSFEDFDDRGGETGRYEITNMGIRLVGGMREKPETMVFFRSRQGHMMTGLDDGEPCILLMPKVLKRSDR